jgi:hypothetical protein
VEVGVKRAEGFEPAVLPLRVPRSSAAMLCDLGFLHTGRDRSCPPRTSGSRCGADPARTIGEGAGNSAFAFREHRVRDRESLALPVARCYETQASGAGAGIVSFGVPDGVTQSV